MFVALLWFIVLIICIFGLHDVFRVACEFVFWFCCCGLLGLVGCLIWLYFWWISVFAGGLCLFVCLGCSLLGFKFVVA